MSRVTQCIVYPKSQRQCLATVGYMRGFGWRAFWHTYTPILGLRTYDLDLGSAFLGDWRRVGLASSRSPRMIQIKIHPPWMVNGGAILFTIQ
jgi:hypothetical protein